VLVTGALLAAVCACGPGDEPSQRDGFWFDVREAPTASDLGELGYAPGYETPDTSWTGVRSHGDHAALPFVFSSGHKAAAFVLDVDGIPEERWSLDRHPTNEALLPAFHHPTQRSWRRIEPLADGGLLAIHEGLCLLRLDAESKVLWSGVEGAHHDLHVSGDDVWVLDREVRAHAADERGAWIVDDGLARVSLRDGSVIERLSLLDLLGDSRWSEILDQAIARARAIDVGAPDASGHARRALDPLHANAIVIASDRPQEIVLFLRDVGALAGIGLASRKLEWLQLGPWQGAHDPQIERDGAHRMFLFDNFGRGEALAPASRIVAIDRDSFSTTTVFEDTPRQLFHSPVCGGLAPLPGGLWLVVETTAGRAFQIDTDGTVVWEFRTPFRIEGEGLVAALLDMRPLDDSK